MPGVYCGLSLILTNSGTDLKVKNERGHTSEWTRGRLRPRITDRRAGATGRLFPISDKRSTLFSGRSARRCENFHFITKRIANLDDSDIMKAGQTTSTNERVSTTGA